MLDVQKIDLPAGTRPIVMVVVDTEEEFPWSEFDRANTQVTAMAEVHTAQAVCDAHGVVPTYVADYPVVTQPEGVEPLRSIVADGRGVIGAHLHPWVTPPFDEEVNAHNSYPGNLPAALERDKLQQLGDAIEASFGVRPVCYKAGRYGLGPDTYATLEALGYEVDLSPSPPYDFRADGGPDYSRQDARPFWFGRDRRLLGIPNTGAYVGWAGRAADRVWRTAARPALRRLKAGGILARLGVVQRLRLSPEGFTTPDLVRLTKFLLKKGQRVFVLIYHSSTLKPGCTQYVRTTAERDAFLRTIDDYLAFFLRQLGGVTKTPLELRAELSAQAQEPHS